MAVVEKRRSESPFAGSRRSRWRFCSAAVRVIVVAAMKHVVILGAGFAGLELATRLSESLSDEVRDDAH